MQSKVAIITGASGGIGEEIVRKLAKAGIEIVAVYNKSEEKAQKIKEELLQNDINIDIYRCDLTKRKEVEGLVSYTLNKFGKIDFLINNAGVSETKLFTEVTDEDWNKIINTNLYSAFCITQETAKIMIHNKSGCIINISSIWGLVGASCESIYAISKAGMDAMTKSLAKELGPSNIRVNSIAPGFINTKMNKNLSEEEIETIKDETPLQKIGLPTDIAKCVEWLVNDNFTTGQIISINGGWIII